MILPEERIELKKQIYQAILDRLGPIGKAPERPVSTFGSFHGGVDYPEDEERERKESVYWSEQFDQWDVRKNIILSLLKYFREDLKSEDVWAGEAH